MLRKFSNFLPAFIRQNSGNIVPMFALSLLPVLGLTGAAVDYSLANKARTQLQAAADAASIGSIASSSAGYKAALTMSADGDIPAGVSDATNIFNSIVASKTGFTAPTLTVKVQKTNGQVTSTVTFASTVKSQFMGMMGTNNIAIGGTSSSANGMPSYMDFYLLLDNSPSMGVGATPADVALMVNNTPDQCAFACHDLSNSNSYYALAKSLGVTMRIDVLRTATQSLMDTAATTQGSGSQFRMAIYTMGSSAVTKGLSPVQTLTSNLSSAKTAANNIDLMTVPYQNYSNDMDTDFDGTLAAVNLAISTPGNGTSATTPKKILFFVSDGVADAAYPATCTRSTTDGTRCQEPLTTAICTTMKNRGILIAVLYTTYLPLPTNGWYNTWIAPFANNIGTQMQACASPGLYFEVTPTQGITSAMTALFTKAVKTSRLTK